MKFGILMRMLRYMAPSKGKIILVVIVSVLTSLFSVVSIYSILPLLNAVFSSSPAIQQTSDAKTSTSVQQPLQLCSHQRYSLLCLQITVILQQEH